MNIAVIGIGFIGKELCFHLSKLGHNIIGLHHNEDVTNVDCDIAIITAGANTQDVEILSKSSKKIKKIITDIPTNKIIFISSSQVHGFIEDNQINITNFGLYKKEIENFIETNVDNFCIIRPPNVLGATCEPNKNSIISTWLHKEKIVVYTGVYRTFICVKELCLSISQNLNFSNKTIIDYKGKKNSLKHIAEFCKEPDNITYHQVNSEPANPIGFTKLFTIKDSNIYDKIQSMKKIINISKNSKTRLYTSGSSYLFDLEETEYPNSRVYIFNLPDNKIRGSHFHKEQTEFMSIVKGECLIELKPVKELESKIFELRKGDILKIEPYMIHTFLNINPEECIIVVSSNQKYIPNSRPDTYLESDLDV